jgi:hypothetical protein
MPGLMLMIYLYISWNIIIITLGFLNLIEVNNNKINEKNYIFTIKGAILYILKTNNIKHRNQLDSWCGGINRDKLYREIEDLLPNICDLNVKQKKFIRSTYEKILKGYSKSHVY